MRKNICISITSLGVGGAEKQCLLLAQALKKDHQAYVVVIHSQPRHFSFMEFIKKEQLDVLFLEGHPLKKIKTYSRFLKEKKIELSFSYLPLDILHTVIAGKIAGVPTIIGGIRNARMPGFKLNVLKFMHNFLLDRSIANSFCGMNYFASQGFKDTKLMTIPNGITINTSLTRRPDKSTIKIISVGRFVEQKDYQTALQSLARLKDHYTLSKDIQYCIVGIGPMEKEIRKMIQQLQLENEVELVIQPDNLPELLAEADIYLCSSIFEGFSNSIMEALSHCLPVVATRAGDNDKLIIHEHNGFIVELKAVEAMADCLHELVEQYELRIEMGQRGYKRLEKEFSYQQFQKKYLRLIEHIEDPCLANSQLYIQR